MFAIVLEWGGGGGQYYVFLSCRFYLYTEILVWYCFLWVFFVINLNQGVELSPYWQDILVIIITQGFKLLHYWQEIFVVNLIQGVEFAALKKKKTLKYIFVWLTSYLICQCIL